MVAAHITHGSKVVYKVWPSRASRGNPARAFISAWAIEVPARGLVPSGSSNTRLRPDDTTMPSALVTAAPTPADPEAKDRHASLKATCQASERPDQDSSVLIIDDSCSSSASGSDDEQATAKLCSIESEQVAVAFGPLARDKIGTEAAHRPLFGLRPDSG